MKKKVILNRYVPQILGSWDNSLNSEYDALSVVTYNYASYTSRQFVPTGINITNTDFWVCTGNYNAELENFKNDTNSQLSSMANQKADKTETSNIQTQVNNLVLGAVGAGNNAEVVQARGSYNLLNRRLDAQDTAVSSLLQYDYATYAGAYAEELNAGYYDKTSGVAQSNTNYMAKKIAVSKGDRFKVCSWNTGNVVSAVKWNSDNGNAVSYFNEYDVTGSYYSVDKEYIIDYNGFIAFQSYASNYGILIQKGSVKSVTADNIDKVKQLENSTSEEIDTEITSFAQSVNDAFKSPTKGVTSYSANTNSKFVVVPCKKGDKFKVYTSVTNITGVKLAVFLGAYFSATGGYVEATAIGTDYRTVEITEDCSYVAFNTRDKNILRVWKQSLSIVSDLSEQADQRAFDDLEESDRLYAIENRIGFTWSPFDKGKIVFIIDDAMANISDVKTIFDNHSMPLSIACPTAQLTTIANNGNTIQNVLMAIQNAGGEIWSHSTALSSGWSATLSKSDAENLLRQSKKDLREAGFDVNGWIAPEGIYCANALTIYPKYYRYAYFGGTKLPYNLPRYNITSLGLATTESYVDTCGNDKSLLILMAHFTSAELSVFSLANLDTLLTYITSKSNVEVTTVKNVYYTYGSKA